MVFRAVEKVYVFEDGDRTDKQGFPRHSEVYYKVFVGSSKVDYTMSSVI